MKKGANVVDKTVLCMWCDKPASHYCDAFIGMEVGDTIRDKTGKTTTLVNSSMNGWTCDAPMCATHSKVIGHICGEGGCETIDYCPYHVAENSLGMNLIVESQSEELRRHIHAMIRRSRIRVAA